MVTMKRIFAILSAAMVFGAAVCSCEDIGDKLDGGLGRDDNEEVEGDNDDTAEGDNDDPGLSDYLILIDAEGVTDENMLQYCVNMTHQYRYEIAGIEDCSWVRVRYVQNMDGNDWTPLLTVDPNETGQPRAVKIRISLDMPSWNCEHEIRQE